MQKRPEPSTGSAWRNGGPFRGNPVFKETNCPTDTSYMESRTSAQNEVNRSSETKAYKSGRCIRILSVQRMQDVRLIWEASDRGYSPPKKQAEDKKKGNFAI